MRLVVETLGCPDDTIEALGNYIYRETGGNEEQIEARYATLASEFAQNNGLAMRETVEDGAVLLRFAPAWVTLP